MLDLRFVEVKTRLQKQGVGVALELRFIRRNSTDALLLLPALDGQNAAPELDAGQPQKRRIILKIVMCG